MEKVIYCMFSCAALLAEVPHSVLFDSVQGKVATVDNITLLHLRARDPVLPLIYFSPDTYEEAIRGLSKAEIQAVLVKRLQDWSPYVLDHALGWTYERKQKTLTLAAQGATAGSAEISVTLRNYFREGVSLLSGLVGEGRYEEVSFTDLIVFALEKEALLIAELQAVDGKQPSLMREIEERTQTIAYLSQFLAKRGMREYIQAPIYIELWRVFYIAPADDRLRAQLKMDYEPFVPWQEGIVARWRVRQVPQLKEEGRSVMVLYYNSGEFLSDLSDLTLAQLTRNLMTRSQVPSSSRDKYLNGLRLELLLLWLTIYNRSVEEKSFLPTELTHIVDIEMNVLISRLAQDGSSLDEKKELKESVISRLLDEEEDLLRDLELFSDLARQSGAQDLVKSLLRVITLTRSQVTQLEFLNKARR